MHGLPTVRPLSQAELPAARALRGEEVVDLPMAITAADGRVVRLLVTASPLRDGDAIAGALAIGLDVSARRESEAPTGDLRVQGDELRQQGAALATVNEALDRQRRLLDAILGTLPYRVTLWGRDERIAWANERFAAEHGEDREALAGRSWRDLGHPLDVVEPLVRMARDAVLAGATVTREVEVAGTDGQEWRACTFLPFNRDAVLVVTGDVSERRRTEAALAREHELLERLIETVPVMISIHDPALGRFHLNRAVGEILGYTDEDAADGRLLERTYPDPAYRATVEAFMRSLEPGWRDMTVTARDGSVVPTSWANFRLGSDVEVGVGIDLRERTRMEAALRESEERFRLALRNAPTAVIHQDADLRYTWYSHPHPPFVSLDLLGKTDADVMAPEDAARITSLKREVLATGEARRGEVSVTADGATTYYDLAVEPARDGEGRIVGVMGVSHEITERREAEAEVARYAERLRHSNEELQRFAYVASHDLQEPLRSIVSFSQLLERRYKGKLDNDADEFIAFIVEGGNRMQRLIADLLQVSRIETQAKPPVPTDVGEVVAGVLRSMDAALREVDATVEVGDLPAVMADLAQLEQVFANLVGNAIKYRREGVPPAIRISAGRHDGMVEFAVADNGIGIEPEYYDRIFEMFRRLHTHDEYEGTGIGLAVVKRIVERHGGTIRVESTPGEGSTFFFSLPAA